MDPSNSTNSNILIVLCGLVGSGKSTFATALQREFPEVRRCNQDELGRREDVEREVHAALSQGLSVCVDRTNFDPGQRRTWIDIARQHSNIEIWGITMDTPFDANRTSVICKDHPTLKTPEKAVEGIYQFVPISANEGFNRVYRIAPRENPDYTREELENILAAIRESPYAPFPDALPQASRSSQDRGRRGYFSSRGSGSHGWRSIIRHRHHHHGVQLSRPTTGFELGNWRVQGSSSTDSHRGYGYRAGAGVEDGGEGSQTTALGTCTTEEAGLIPEGVQQELGLKHLLDLSHLPTTPT
ncbi:AAA domain protein [Rhizoctonia solani]|uniref:AAA domain protein n=1 Tax=Rhizoctonia solani TaxID=456999 RepID=A0A8H8NPB7_9AGAM|nr:AAA domain protein [Rhizoctonia solani]QRW16850.1 AAA domain protein [Rhizoctonia solani]